MIVEDLENITSGWTKNCHGVSHSLLNDAYLIRLASHLTELGGDLQSAQLRHCNHNQNFGLIMYIFFLKENIIYNIIFLLLPTNEKITIGVIESPVFHRSIAQIHMYRDTLTHFRIARTAQSVKTLDKIDFRISSIRDIERLPS